MQVKNQLLHVSQAETKMPPASVASRSPVKRVTVWALHAQRGSLNFLRLLADKRSNVYATGSIPALLGIPPRREGITDDPDMLRVRETARDSHNYRHRRTEQQDDYSTGDGSDERHASNMTLDLLLCGVALG